MKDFMLLEFDVSLKTWVLQMLMMVMTISSNKLSDHPMDIRATPKMTCMRYIKLFGQQEYRFWKFDNKRVS